MAGIVISTVSPEWRKRGGLKPTPTPLGVPVAMTSPGKRVAVSYTHLMDGSIMITASHLPYNRNGLKFFTKDGGLEKKEVKEVLTLASNLTATAVSTAAIASLDLIERYALHLRQKICAGLCAGMFDRPLEGMHIVVDAGNGSGGFFATKVLAPVSYTHLNRCIRPAAEH